jgi:Spermidine/putrescine-binding periplasmic protein
LNLKKRIALTLSLIVGLTALYGCQKTGKPASSGYAKQISFYQFTEYTPQSVLKGFQKKYGIKVKMTEYTTNEEMIAKFAAGQTAQYDLCVPSNYVIKEMVARNFIEPYDKSGVPNMKNIDASCLDRDYDPGNKYTVPYLLAPCVLVVNTSRIKQKITSYNDLLNPAFKNALVVVDDERHIIGLALKALGLSINDTKTSDIARAAAWLQKLKPNIKVYNADSPKTNLISGDCSIGYVFDGEAAAAINANHHIKLVIPKEGIGGTIIDNLALVKGTKHKKEAELFMNYLLEPSVSKEISASYPYTNPNRAAHNILGPAYLNNPASNISWSNIKKAELIEDVGSALTAYDNVWSAFKG